MLPHSLEELEKIKRDCLRMSRRRAFLSAAASIVPVPFTDIATDVVLLKQIIPKISDKFGVSKDQIDEYNPQAAIFIYDAAKRLGAKMIGKHVTKQLIIQVLRKAGARFTTKQAAKYVPVIGQAISAGISFTAMRFIIHSHIDECYKVAGAAMESRRTI